MNDIRRTILWVIFGFSMVMLWDQWQVHNGNKATFFPSSAKTAASAAPASASAAPAASGVPSSNAVAASAQVPATTATAPAQASAPRERVVISTDVLNLTLDSEGGTIVKSEFVKHADMADPKKSTVLLDESKDRFYVAQTGLIGGAFPTHKTPMTVTGERVLKDGVNELAVKFESPDLGGVKLVKTYTFKRGSYAVAVKHDVINTGSAPVSPQLYLQLVRDGNKPPGESSFYSTFTGPAVFTDAKKYQKVEFSDIEKGKTEEVDKNSPNGYVAMVQHYFASAWLLADGVVRENFVRKVDTNLYAVGMITPVKDIAPGSSKSVEARFFVGPQEEKVLESLAPGLELVKDYGWLTILAKPLYWLLDQLHKVIANWGWSIVALVFLLKVAFYWLNAKAYASMAKMKAINPKIMEMRERLKDNPQQMQQEMMRIYREEKVNPMGGCFPILIQIPVFIALYWVLLSSVEMRNAPWILWIKDLSTPDPYYILPLLMTVTSMLQTALNPAPPDPMQAKMMWIMPLVFSVMFFFFPAGLVLYWLTNNILSIAQQWVINTRMGVPPQFNLPKF
ncbi:MAG TPA: membrane protein insertase YidC [Burkholderiaceae bacterium]|nr:membrane protein insertase YidC [Burkholderiaceae bacterium]